VARAEEPGLIYLDTHVVMWLHDGLVERLSDRAAAAIDSGRLLVSGMVELELQYLREVGRIRPSARDVLLALEASIGLSRSDLSLARVAEAACALNWTRDPFDRMIVAEATLARGRLVTRDEMILDNSPAALW
jgi:PIN domain nuclease of toxin-antitoxin system